MGTLSNNSKVGDKGKDLILQTSGRVYVQVKDRFYEVNFRGDDSDKKEEDVEETPRVIFVDDANILDDSYPYPGDDYLIIADGEFFQTVNGEYKQIKISTQSNTTFSTPLTITTLESPFNINSTKLVKNLNAEFINGISSSSIARKDLNETISKWSITELISDSVKDLSGKTILNLKNSSLSIDTIRVKNLIVSEDSNNNNDNEDNLNSGSDFDVINKKTYFSDGISIKSVKIIDKLSSNIQILDNEYTRSIEYFSNENYLVGGYSIIDLIYIAYNNGFLTELDSIVDYANTLTNCQKLNDGYQWVPYTLTGDDFVLNDEDVYPYKQYKYTPVSKSIYEQYAYGVKSNCLESIYNKWYNITDYIDPIKSKYQGLSYELEVNSHTLDANTLLTGNNSNGIIEALVVGCTENTIRIIISGTDCYFSNNTAIDIYNEWEEYTPTEEPNLSIYNNIKSCIEAQEPEKGKTISNDPKVGNVLFTGNADNIIGNISGVNNSVFGTLEGYGLSSEGNCYFINPGIALANDFSTYIKLTNKDTSFIGIDSKDQPWINIGKDGSCIMQRENMYNINNTVSYCSFGPIIVQEDGSATIGTGDTQIVISSTGEIKIPAAAII